MQVGSSKNQGGEEWWGGQGQAAFLATVIEEGKVCLLESTKAEALSSCPLFLGLNHSLGSYIEAPHIPLFL